MERKKEEIPVIREWRQYVCMGIYYNVVWVGSVCNEYHRSRNCEGRTGESQKAGSRFNFLIGRWMMAVRIAAGWNGPFYYRPENSLVINYVLPKLYPSGGSVILPVCFRRFHYKC